MRPAALAALGLALGVAGLIVYREAKGAARPSLPVGGDEFFNAVYRVENLLYDALGSRGSTSLDGLEAIKRHEAFSPTPYADQAGHPTIGYGHKLKPGESFTAITEGAALELLAADVRVAEDAVNSVVSVPLAQAQFDALVSFAFNVGAAAFRDSTLVKRLNAGEYAAVPSELARWKYVTQGGVKVVSDGLVARRVAEGQAFA